MSFFHHLGKLTRIPHRLYLELKVIALLNNWPEAIYARIKNKKIKNIYFRNKINIVSPETISLKFLFQEIWLEEIYKYPGYTISPGDTIIDIGANIGAFSVYAATRSSEVRVYAYEPFPENIAWLQLNLKNNNITNVKIFPQAVAGLSSTRILEVCHFWIGHSLKPEGVTSEGIPVSCITLEDIFKSNDLQKCDLLKIDCEGSEYEILQNSTPETLKKVKKIVCEYHTDPNEKATVQSLCHFLQNRSFRIDQVKALGSDTGILFAQQVY